MRRIAPRLLLAVLLAAPTFAATPASFERSVRPRLERAASGPARLAAATVPPPDWPAWFAKNTTVTDKKSYVHFFWNANDVRARLAGREREALLAEAARQLVVRQFPAKASADLVKVDVVFVAERDGYGMPKWDSLQRVAHLEGSRKKLLAAPASASLGELKKVFDRFDLF